MFEPFAGIVVPCDNAETTAALPQQSLQRCLSPEELFVMTNRRMGLFRNRHKGQRCVIIGNGPSLNKMDLSFLENEITFGMNRIFLLFDTWKFRPTYYVSVNPLVIEQSAEEILKIDAPKFLSHKGIPFFNDPGDIHFLQSIPHWFFSKDPRNGICEGWTVTYVAMQLAYFMGFEEVVLIGVDHHFVTQGDPNKEVVSEGDDPNHFHPDYFGKGIRWHLPDLERSEGSYRMAKQAFEAANRRIIDATVGGKLAVFPKADYRELFHVANSADGSLSSVTSENRENESVISSSGLRISVITPSFNQGNYIEQTIRSVIDQNYPDLEHFVIDGGSSDATLDILKRYPQLNWVSETDRGQADALNKGFRKATGDIIAWINSDDWYEPGAFRAVADFFTANPEKNIVMGDCNLVDRNGAIFDKVINQERGFDELKKHWISRSIPTQPAIFFRKNLLDQFGMLDESLHFAMDYDLWMRFAQKNRLYHLEQTVANYRFHNDAKGGDQNWSKFLPDCLTVYDRYCQPQVSVVIPCYNYAHYLGEAVQSVLAQTYQELEIIIVNDGSTDNTIGVADKIIAAHPHIRIRLINQANSGQPAASRNRGISEAKGKYILPLDADDMIDPTMVQKMVDILDRNDTVDIVYCDTIRFGDVNNSYQTEEWNLQRLASVNTMNYCALFRGKVWDDIGGYRLDCGYEDWDFWISAAEKGFKGYRIPEYLFYYRIKQSGRLLLDQQNDARNKAKIVNNHPNLYDESTKAWAKNILTADFDKGKKAQILFVVHNFPPHWYAGVEIYSYQLATSLIKKGIDVSVLYPFHREGMVIPEIEETSLDGIKIFRLLSDHSLPEHGGLTSQVANKKQERVFADFLQRHNFNVVHFHHTLGMPFSFITIARNHGCPVCVTLHDYWFLCVGIHLYDISTNSLCSGPDSPSRCADCLLPKIRQTPSLDDRSLLEKWIQSRTSHAVDILRNTDCIVSPSHYLADIHQKYGISQSIEVSPLGLNGIRKSKRVTGSPLVFAFLGNIHELKNAYLLAEAFKGVTGEARLLYFGSGEKHYIDKLIAEIEGDERITYRGGYSPSQLADILDQVDIVVVPSISENYPLVVREALSAGVPVLASRVGGIPEIVTHLRNGILFDPADKQELELWLQTFVDRPELILELKMNILPVKTMDQDANEWVERYARISSPPENVEHTLQPTTETGIHGTNAMLIESNRNPQKQGRTMTIDQNRFHQSEACRTRYERLKIQLEVLPLDESLRTVENFLKESPNFAEAHNDLGVLYFKEGNKLQALGHYEKAVRLAPLNSTFRKNLASFYFVEMGWTDDAIAIYTDILTSYPSDIEVLTALGIISNAIGRPEEAGIFFRRIIELEPWNDEVRKALTALDPPSATCLETLPSEPIEIPVPSRMSEIDDILASLRKPTPPPEDSPDELYRKALKLANDGFIEQAIADLHRLLLQDTDNALIHNDLAVLYSQTGDAANALFYQEKAVGLAPYNSNFQKNLAGLYYSSGNRSDDAIALYTRLLRENSDDVEILGALAIISIENLRPDEAMIFLDKIIELEPGNGDARRLREQISTGNNEDFFLSAG